MNRVEEFLIAVIPNAGFFIRRDVGRIRRAERQPDRKASGVVLSASRRMTGHAISRLGEILTPLDEGQLGERNRDAGGITGFIVLQSYFLTIYKSHRSRPADDPNGYRQPHRNR